MDRVLELARRKGRLAERVKFLTADVDFLKEQLLESKKQQESLKTKLYKAIDSKDSILTSLVTAKERVPIPRSLPLFEETETESKEADKEFFVTPEMKAYADAMYESDKQTPNFNVPKDVAMRKYYQAYLSN